MPKWEYCTLQYCIWQLKETERAAIGTIRVEVVGEGGWSQYKPDGSERKISKSQLEALNKLGEEGWELVGIEPRIEEQRTVLGNLAVISDCPVYIFKKPKQ